MRLTTSRPMMLYCEAYVQSASCGRQLLQQVDHWAGSFRHIDIARKGIFGPLGLQLD